jgi:DNA-binding CsgD family transcriptional regulator
MMGMNKNITVEKRNEGVIFFQNRVLELLAKEHSLNEVLDYLISGIEKQTKSAMGSILLLDETGKKLFHGASPHLPKPFTEAIDGVPVGPNIGSCGTAAYRKETVIVEDIANDPLWARGKGLALRHGLQACWSSPIFSKNNQVLGTFALYYNTPQKPSGFELGLIRSSANIAGIAIENKRNEKKIRDRTQELENKNQALQEILSQIEIEKKEIRDAITVNSEKLLLPLIKKLRNKSKDTKTFDLLESNIRELTSEFGGKISSKLLKLSPKELELCNLIKNGFESKEIATLHGISKKTVDTHRRNIRHKLGIANSETNLTVYLNSI